jgi:hypothetical protein
MSAIMGSQVVGFEGLMLLAHLCVVLLIDVCHRVCDNCWGPCLLNTCLSETHLLGGKNINLCFYKDWINQNDLSRIGTSTKAAVASWLGRLDFAPGW